VRAEHPRPTSHTKAQRVGMLSGTVRFKTWGGPKRCARSHRTGPNRTVKIPDVAACPFVSPPRCLPKPKRPAISLHCRQSEPSLRSLALAPRPYKSWKHLFLSHPTIHRRCRWGLTSFCYLCQPPPSCDAFVLPPHHALLPFIDGLV
jgi:hypothetical protein